MSMFCFCHFRYIESDYPQRFLDTRNTHGGRSAIWLACTGMPANRCSSATRFPRLENAVCNGLNRDDRT